MHLCLQKTFFISSVIVFIVVIQEKKLQNKTLICIIPPHFICLVQPGGVQVPCGPNGSTTNDRNWRECIQTGPSETVADDSASIGSLDRGSCRWADQLGSGDGEKGD